MWQVRPFVYESVKKKRNERNKEEKEKEKKKSATKLTVDVDSELHVFRGHQPSKTGFIMGHEFTGTVIKVGSAVKSLTVGDVVVCPFTTSWYVIKHSFLAK